MSLNPQFYSLSVQSETLEKALDKQKIRQVEFNKINKQKKMR